MCLHVVKTDVIYLTQAGSILTNVTKSSTKSYFFPAENV